MIQNLWDAAKSVLWRKFIAIQSNLKKEEEQKNSKVSTGKEIIKLRAEITEKEMKETITKINKTKSWFLKKINKIDKLKKKNKKTKGEYSNQQN